MSQEKRCISLQISMGIIFEKSIKLKLGNTETISIFGEKVAPYKIAGEILKKA